MADFSINGQTYKLVDLADMDNLTLGEVELFEDVSGSVFSDLMPGPNGEARVSVKSAVALVLISMRRSNPAATVDEARLLPISQLSALFAEDADAEDPPQPVVASEPATAGTQS